MQNAQNTEIQQRVINLVDLYRTKVGGVDSENYKAVCEYEKAEEQKQIEAQKKNGSCSFSTSITIPDELANKIKVNEQLLGHFYKIVIGKNAEEGVVNQLLANYYDDTILSRDDESFLISHFKEMVHYIIITPCNHLSSNDWDGRDIYLIPEEVLNLVCEHISIPKNAIVYNPFAGFAQFATKLENCNFICEDSYSVFYKDSKISDDHLDVSAWAKVVLAANGIDNKNTINERCLAYDAVVSYIPYIPMIYGRFGECVTDEGFLSFLTSVLNDSYHRLKDNGKMGLIIPNELLWNGNGQYYLKAFWEELIRDGSLSEIIQLPSVMSYNCHHDYSVVVITKRTTLLTSIIDARFASRDLSNLNVISMNDLLSEKGEAFVKTGVSMRALKIGEEKVLMAKNGNSNFIKVLDNNRLKSILENGGKDSETGLHKMIKIDGSNLNVNLLVPQVYVIETPSSDENPVPLSTQCSMVWTRVKDIKYELPNDTPWIKDKNLSYIFQGGLDLSSRDVEKADCPNMPPHTDDYVFKENGELDSELPWSQRTEIGRRVIEYRDSFFLDGSKDAVLYKKDEKGARLSLIRATGKPYAVDNRIFVFIPSDAIDALQLYVLLSMPLVYRQIQTFRDFGIYRNLQNVLVPLDKRIMKDAERKALNEENAYKFHEEKLLHMKTEYINEVRMRKHDMSQYIFELSNIEDLIRYYIENRETETDCYKQITDLLNNFRSSLAELSSLLDNLSKEEQFGVPERLNLDELLSHLSDRHKADGFKINYYRDDSSIRRYNQKQYIDDSLEDLLLDAEIQTHEDDMALEDAMLDAEIQTHEDDMALEDAMLDAEILAHEDDMALENAILDAEIQANEDDLYETDDISADVDDLDIIDSSMDISRGSYVIPSLYVAPNDMQRLVSNIVDNARKHGFTDHSRKDYEIKVFLSIDVEKNMFQIDFKNNGNPLPEGMNKMRYGIKGEKAGQTAGTGMGGSYVKSFVEHYGGDYEIFMDGEWTVVRIYLPIK